MHIKNVKVKGIRAIKNLREYQFDDGLTFIRGENMTGKTSVFYAIQFALFGVAGVNLTAGELFNKQSNSSEVELTFEVGSDTLKVVRGRSKAELFMEGEDEPVAVGNSVVTSYLKDLLNSNGKNLVITASSVVEMVHPSLLAENNIDMDGFRVLSTVDLNVKTYLRYLKDRLVDIPVISAPSEEDIKEAEERNEEIEKKNAEINAKKTTLQEALQIAKRRDELNASIKEYGGAVSLTTLEEMKTMRGLANYAGLPKIPEGYLALRKEWDEYKKCKGIPENIIEDYEKAVSDFEEAKEYNRWEKYRPEKPDMRGRTKVELLAIQKKYEAVQVAKTELKTGVCNACGTVLNKEQVEKAKKVLDKYSDLPTWARTAYRILEDLKEYENYPELSVSPKYPYGEARRRVQALEHLYQRAKVNRCAGGGHEPGEPLSKVIEEVIPSDVDEAWVANYNAKIEKVEALPYYTEKQYQDALMAAKFLSELSELPDTRPTKELLSEYEEVKDTPLGSLTDVLDMKRRRMGAKEVNKEREDIIKLISTHTEFRKVLNDAIKKVQDRIWDSLLSNASKFCSDITEGVIYHIGKNEKGFYYMEDGVVHSVSTGSGLQRSLIGLSLQITKKMLSGDTMPLLLDEVTGRMSDKYRHKFTAKLATLPYQVVLITHTKDSGETLEVS